MMPGETEGLEGAVCECGQTLPLRVLHTPAGYYLGYFCLNCGPWSRETDYMTESEARTELKKVRETGYSTRIRI